jgi:aspartate/methionine/tyrosine aminotransferase
VSDDAYVLDGFSKRYAMTGFRLGWLVAPRDRVRPLQILAQNLFISANRFVQRAGIAALAHGAETALRMRDTYSRRRDRMVAGLRALGFGVPHVPDGAFYVFADARAFGSDSRALAFDLLERAHVGTTPGVDFGAAGEGWLRFSYAASDATIEEALARLAGALPARR